MCGIWGLITCETILPTWTDELRPYCETLKARGPETFTMRDIPTKGLLAFTRLAINGLTAAGDQPMTCDANDGNLTWICNGEIYNYKELAARYNIPLEAGAGDCQIIGPLYRYFATKSSNLAPFFRALDGVFSLIIIDQSRKEVIVGRDPYGVRPLYYAEGEGTYYFSSEMKGIPYVDVVTNMTLDDVGPFPPGNYMRIEHVEGEKEFLFDHMYEYHAVPHLKVPALADEMVAIRAIETALVAAVKKRMLMERPVAALLSGGIDSSLIAALVARELRMAGRPPLETFSIGFEGSEDLAYARKVAAWIGSKHHEIVMTPDDFFAAISMVIHDIESYDTTTVRASVGNWLLGREIRRRSDAKVVFNGDGSDEVFGSYMYFYKAPTDEEFELESERLLKEIHMFDVLRSDRSISSHGLEPRTPFLDKEFVATARAVSTALRRPGPQRPEKWILRRAFEYKGLLPNDVLWRKKEAFSDGVSGPTKLWFQEIQERVYGSSGSFSGQRDPLDAEKEYYLKIFEGYYPDRQQVNVPHFWMPRFIDGVTDPSARTLAVYDEAEAKTLIVDTQKN
jgi:asparagine synthase (glutamine-hydrolysing)